MKERFLRLALLLGCLFGLLAAFTLSACADAGDYDQIENYNITVDPRQDGSVDITYEVDWNVIGGGKNDYLSWVKIGLANSHADNFEILTPDTVSKIDYLEDGGSYARLVFAQRYYAPAVAAGKGAQSSVHFSFKVHQSHLFSLNDDSTASFEFTPGWFTDLCVEHMQIRWRSYDGFIADNTGTDGDYLTWDFGPLEHGQAGTARVTVPVTTAQGYDSAQAMSTEDWAPKITTDEEDDDGSWVVMVFLILFLVVLVAVVNASRTPQWVGGLGYDTDDFIWYTNGLRTMRLARGIAPPANFHPTTPPAGSVHTGGGTTRGGGAGRHGGGGSSGCVCACASSCACACACAGGGRAGCSVKNFYKVKIPAEPPVEKKPE